MYRLGRIKLIKLFPKYFESVQSDTLEPKCKCYTPYCAAPYYSLITLLKNKKDRPSLPK